MKNLDEKQMEQPGAQSAGFSEKKQSGTSGKSCNAKFKIGDLLLGRCKVLAELEMSGGLAVYKCLDGNTGKDVALKVLPPELSHNTLEMEDVKEVFQLAHNLQHPNIASCNSLEYDRTFGVYCLIMEFVNGENLRQWIRRKRNGGTLTLTAALPMLSQVAAALDYAHGKMVIHGDVKPENILIDGGGTVKVSDFSLSEQIRFSMARVSMAYRANVSNVSYLSPEKWHGRVQGAASDQYALAVIIYEMLAGYLPFENKDIVALRDAVAKENAGPLLHYPTAVNQVLAHAMSKEPKMRFANCEQFIQALSEASVSPVHKKNALSPKWIAAVAAIVILAIGGGVSAYYRKEQENLRMIEEARNFEVMRQAAEMRIAEVERHAEDVQKDAKTRIAAAERRAEEVQKNAETRIAAAERRAEEVRKAAEMRIFAAERRAEEARKIAEAQQNLLKGRQSATEQAIAYFDKNDYQNAFEYCRKADMSNPEIQFLLGYMYGTGQGVALDNAEAVRWFRKSAEQGYAKAQRNLGIMLENGLGVEKDEKEAAKWYRKAAWQGNVTAQYNLGLMYQLGKGVEQSNFDAIIWYHKAAAQQCAKAQCNLGLMYEHGWGTPKDEAMALKWYRQAAEQGSAVAQYNLGLMYERGVGVKKNISEALRWYRKAASRGDENARNALLRLRQADTAE